MGESVPVKGRVVRRPSVRAPDDVPEETVAEREYEERADEIEQQVEEGVSLAVVDEYGLETEAVGDRVDDVLHEFPEDADGDGGGEDARARVAATASSGGVNEPPEERRRVDVSNVVPPRRVVVQAEHPNGVGEHGGLGVHALPRA